MSIDLPPIVGLSQTFKQAVRVIEKDPTASPLGSDMAPGADHVSGGKLKQLSKPKKLRKRR